MLARATAQAGGPSAPDAAAFTAFRLPSLLAQTALARNSPSHPSGPACAGGTRLCSSSNKARSTHRLERCASRLGCAARRRKWGLAPTSPRRAGMALVARGRVRALVLAKPWAGGCGGPFALPRSAGPCGRARTRAPQALDGRTLSERSEPQVSEVSCAPGRKGRAPQGSPSGARACASGPQRPPAQGFAVRIPVAETCRLQPSWLPTSMAA